MTVLSTGRDFCESLCSSQRERVCVFSECEVMSAVAMTTTDGADC